MKFRSCHALICNFQTVVIIGLGKCLNEEKKLKIVQQLKQGKTIKQISAIVKRDPRTITRFLDDPLKKRVRRDQGKMKALSTRELSRVTRQLKKMSTTSSNIIFRNAGLQNISKSTS